MSDPYRVLFVCWGNICRSPAAEGVLNHLVARDGLEGSIATDSAGTIRSQVGWPPDSRMRETGARRGIAIEGSARILRPSDLEDFDLILAMDDYNLSCVEELVEEHGDGRPDLPAIGLFCEYTGLETREVPDPYYGGQDGFDLVLDLLETGCANLIQRIRNESNLA